MKLYACSNCDKTFNDKSNFRVHSRTHELLKLLKCDDCKLHFPNHSMFLCHLRSHVGFKLFKCDLCDNTFADPLNYLLDLLVHVGFKPYKCDQCDKIYYTKRKFLNHLKSPTVHRLIGRKISRKKIFECGLCEKQVLKKNSKRHLRSHTGEKPYKCTYCTNCYASNSSLKCHLLRIHSDAIQNGPIFSKREETVTSELQMYK